MKRNTLNFWIDFASFLVFFALFMTGLLIHYVLPPCESCDGGGCKDNQVLTLWGLGRHVYGKVHFYLALATAAAILLHVCLHWSWVCATCCNLLGSKAASPDRREQYGALLLLLLIMVTIAILYWAKTQAR